MKKILSYYLQINPINIFSTSFFIVVILLTGCNSVTNLRDTKTVKVIDTLIPKETLSFPPSPISTPFQTIIPTTNITSTITQVPEIDLSRIGLSHFAEWKFKSVDSIAWAPDSQHVAISSVVQGEYKTYLINIETKLVTWGIDNASFFLTFSPDGNTLVSGSKGIEFWDTKNGQPIDTPFVSNADFFPRYHLDDMTLILGMTWLLGDEAKTRIGTWDRENRQMITLIEEEGLLVNMEVSPIEDILATKLVGVPNEPGHQIILWEIPTWEKCCTIPGNDFTLSPTESILAVVVQHNNQTLTSLGLYDTKTCEFIKKIYETSYIDSIAYDPTGQVIAVADEQSKTIKIIDSSTGIALSEQRGAWDTVWQLLFSPDGRFLMSRESHGTEYKVSIWQVTMVETK